MIGMEQTIDTYKLTGTEKASDEVSSQLRKTSTRDQRFDILRSVSMMMIVMLHYIYHGIRHVGSDGGGNFVDCGFTQDIVSEVNFLIYQFLGYMADIGPNLFILISGYFLIKPRSFQSVAHKAGHLWTTIAFYCIVIYGVLLAMGQVDFSVDSIISGLTPIYHKHYWFMSMYVPLLLLSPFLSKGIAGLTKREYEVLLLVLLVIHFSNNSVGYGHIYSSGTSLFFYIFVFLAGGYLRLYPIDKRIGKWGGAAYLMVCLVLTLLSAYSQLIKGTGGFPHIKGMANNSLPFLYAFFLFAWVVQLKRTDTLVGRWAVRISPYVLAVYLIHDNGNIRRILWNQLIHTQDFIHSPWSVVHFAITCALIFVLCIAIEWLRQYTSKAIKMIWRHVSLHA